MILQLMFNIQISNIKFVSIYKYDTHIDIPIEIFIIAVAVVVDDDDVDVEDDNVFIFIQRIGTVIAVIIIIDPMIIDIIILKLVNNLYNKQYYFINEIRDKLCSSRPNMINIL